MRTVVAAVLGGLTIFVWGAATWTVLHWRDADFVKFQETDKLVESLAASTDGSGLYLYPSPQADPSLSAEEQEKQFTEQMEAGPFVYLVYDADGGGEMGPAMAKGVVISIISAGLLALLVQLSGQDEFARRMQICLVASVAAASLCHLPNWNWWHHPTSFTIKAVIDVVVGGGLAGLIVSALVPKQDAQSASNTPVGNESPA